MRTSKHALVTSALAVSCSVTTSFDDLSKGSPPGAEAGAPDGGGATSTGDGGSDGGTVAPIDGGTDGSGTPDAGVVASSCKALLASAPSTPSGRYVIDPDGAGAAAPFQVYCDMSTAGGGWTEVFLALPNLASSTLDYTSASPRLLADGTETLIAFRASSLAVSGTTAVFSLPAAWKTASPFKARNADLTVQVSIDGATPREGKLRYGTANFLDTCAGDWNLAEDWGRLCIAGTTAAFFVGWAIDEADTCQDSSKLWSAVDCASADRRFSISVR